MSRGPGRYTAGNERGGNGMETTNGEGMAPNGTTKGTTNGTSKPETGAAAGQAGASTRAGENQQVYPMDRSMSTVLYVGQYKILECLGSGTIGTVHKAILMPLCSIPIRRQPLPIVADSNTGVLEVDVNIDSADTRTTDYVAIKAISLERVAKLGTKKYLESEIETMRLLRHPNVVRIERTMLSRERLYIVMEYCETDLERHIQAMGGKLKEWEAHRFFKDILRGLGHCHERGVAWRDAKPANLMIDHNGVLKIGDFGFAVKMKITEGTYGIYKNSTSVVGTLGYAAPEVLAQSVQGYDPVKADIWSIGCVLFMMLTGHLPHNTHDRSASSTSSYAEDMSGFSMSFERVEEYRSITGMVTYEDYNTSEEVFKEFEEVVGKDAGSLVRWMIDKDPTKRPTIEQIWESTWVASKYKKNLAYYS